MIQPLSAIFNVLYWVEIEHAVMNKIYSLLWESSQEKNNNNTMVVTDKTAGTIILLHVTYIKCLKLVIHIQGQFYKEQVSFEGIWIDFQPQIFLPVLVIVLYILLFSCGLIILIIQSFRLSRTLKCQYS